MQNKMELKMMKIDITSNKGKFITELFKKVEQVSKNTSTCLQHCLREPESVSLAICMTESSVKKHDSNPSRLEKKIPLVHLALF